ncbi:MAG: glycosyltransferase family 39 protein [Candidatus Omnitrophica bacterium]|nr:glycosyltransferase family 39 protein [Candidatus Omnitrophota bacterium]MBU1810564.1 glycosyltransferase family 39 protein [Candidatus Omnitrophota bacterium]
MKFKLNRGHWVLRRYNSLFILVVLLIIYNSFFLNKAFHIDDPFTIDIARAVNKNFLNVPQVFFSNPILLGYYYGPIIKLFGEREIILHIFSLPFALLAIVAMFILSVRFTKKGLLPTLFLVISPAFLIMSHNIMLDIPLLSFFLGALAAFVYGVDKDNNFLLFFSGILAGMAILTKYSGLMVLPLMFIYAWLFSKRRCGLFLLIPLAVFFLWNIQNIIFYKRCIFLGALLYRLRSFSFHVILERIFASLSFISGTSIVSLFLAAFFLRKRNCIFLFLLSLPVSLCPFLMKGYFIDYTNWCKLALSLFFVFSLFIIFILFKNGLAALIKKPRGKDKDDIFLSLWFFLLLGFTIFIQFVAARFILLLFPPMFLLIYRELSRHKVYFLPKFKKMISFSIIITGLISTILAIGDYHFAGIYRDFPKVIKKISLSANKNICSPCDFYVPYNAWGYAYYLTKYFPRDLKGLFFNLEGWPEEMTKDDIVILPSEPVLSAVVGGQWEERFKKLTQEMILSQRFCYKGNVALHNRRFHTGFYSHDWGLLPFYVSLRKIPLETFNVYAKPE